MSSVFVFGWWDHDGKVSRKVTASLRYRGHIAGMEGWVDFVDVVDLENGKLYYNPFVQINTKIWCKKANRNY